jgi:uncharacterized protein (DUF427 family)
MKARWQGRLIAESQRTLEVGGYAYFPREDVRMELLKVAEKTASDRACPHGVQFYDVSDGRAHSERAAWSYEKPGASMKPIDHWIGFWDDVEVDGPGLRLLWIRGYGDAVAPDPEQTESRPRSARAPLFLFLVFRVRSCQRMERA